MQYSVKLVVLILLSLCSLAACGQKGPLFLPGDPTEVRSISQEPQSRAGSIEEEDEDDDIPRR